MTGTLQRAHVRCYLKVPQRIIFTSGSPIFLKERSIESNDVLRVALKVQLRVNNVELQTFYRQLFAPPYEGSPARPLSVSAHQVLHPMGVPTQLIICHARQKESSSALKNACMHGPTNFTDVANQTNSRSGH